MGIYTKQKPLKVERKLGLKKFDKDLPFNAKDGPFLSKNEIKDLLFKNDILV